MFSLSPTLPPSAATPGAPASGATPTTTLAGRATATTTPAAGATANPAAAAGATANPAATAGAATPGPDAPRSEDETAARLRVAVTRLHRRLRHESLTGVSPSQEAALATISRLGRPTLGELAQAEQVQPPTMTRVVTTMEAAGLVVRLGDRDDRRVIRVELSAEGRRALERIRKLKTAYLARKIAVLPADERARVGMLAALLEELVEDR